MAVKRIPHRTINALLKVWSPSPAQGFLIAALMVKLTHVVSRECDW